MYMYHCNDIHIHIERERVSASFASSKVTFNSQDITIQCHLFKYYTTKKKYIYIYACIYMYKYIYIYLYQLPKVFPR